MKKLYEIFIVLTMRIIYFIFPKAHDSYGLSSLLIPSLISTNIILFYILHIQKFILSELKYNISISIIASCFLFTSYLSFFTTKSEDLEIYTKNSNYKIALIYKFLYVVFILLSLYSLYKLFDLPAPLLKK